MRPRVRQFAEKHCLGVFAPSVRITGAPLNQIISGTQQTLLFAVSFSMNRAINFRNANTSTRAALLGFLAGNARQCLSSPTLRLNFKLHLTDRRGSGSAIATVKAWSPARQPRISTSTPPQRETAFSGPACQYSGDNRAGPFILTAN